MFFQMKLYYPPESYKPIKLCQRHDFLGRFSRQKIGVFHFMWRPFLLFTLAICDLFTPNFRLCWSLLDLYVQKKKEKSPWLKVKKKTGPKKKKKKVFDDEWRKTLADSYIPDCSFGSIDADVATVKATAVFPFFELFLLPGILETNPRNSNRTSCGHACNYFPARC